MKNWKLQLNDLCDYIVEVERKLQDTFHLQPAENGALSWRICDQSNKFRIFNGDKPLAEASTRARVQTSADIPGLIDACDKAMELTFAVIGLTASQERKWTE
jgi:hypothetical protein